MNNKYIYINNNSISKELCFEIINLFENDNNKYQGYTLGGINKNIKDTTDLSIKKDNKIWYNIYNFLYEELSRNLEMYIKNLNSSLINDINNNKTNYCYFKENTFSFELFLIQKYEKNIGKYIYHNDFKYDSNKVRVITYLWYLNDVEEGGETILEDNIIIKPEIGKLLLFPACWTYPHTGKIPISNNKYIITGWIYSDL